MTQSEYSKRLKESTTVDFSFQPKSIWSFKKNTELDKLINDKIAKESMLQDSHSKKDYVNVGKLAFSKFNTEYCRRIIEFWSKPGDTILDPFCGRTRSLVSSYFNRNYIGFDISQISIKETQKSFDEFEYKKGIVQLINNDIRYYGDILPLADLIMTCPPYWCTELYEKGDLQLSRMKTYDIFLNHYKEILQKTVSYLKPGKFCCIVAADFRWNKKFYTLAKDTIKICQELGLEFYDEIVLEMNPAKRHPLYIQSIYFLRALRTHDYLLIFRKPGIDYQQINDEINKSRPKGTLLSWGGKD